MRAFHTKFFLVFWLILCCNSAILSQNIEQIKSDHRNYIWGEGSGTTLREADQYALADIISQISVSVESQFEQSVQEKGKKLTETVNGVIKTYSSSTLTNTHRIIIGQEPNAKVFRYIRRDEVAKVFDLRKQKIIEFAKNGEEYLNKVQIADALRYFYWSQTLLRSHPYAQEIKMYNYLDEEVLLYTWLPLQINNIFSNLSVAIIREENQPNFKEYLLDIRYKQQAVKNLDYTYWSGRDWTNIYSAKDGLGVAELSSNSQTDKLRLRIEYVFENEANIDMELRDVMQQIPTYPYKNAYLDAVYMDERDIAALQQASPQTAIQAEIKSPEAVSTNSSGDFQYGEIKELKDISQQEASIIKILAAIKSKSYATVKNLFTANGYDNFIKLMQYGNAKLLQSGTIKYYQYNDEVICRAVPMSFSFQQNNRTFVEDVVFTMNKDNKIDNIAFALSKQAVDDIASKGQWSQATRMAIISFMENYKTAYALKRLDFIESIFSDNALIITGSVVKVNPNPELKYLNNQIVRYNRQSKTQYMRNLRHCFNSNEFINIRFADNTIRQATRGGDIYGIEIKQDYFSTNYGDTGYLFLLIDMTDSIAPKIQVRTWQPEKHPDGSIYGLSDF